MPSPDGWASVPCTSPTRSVFHDLGPERLSWRWMWRRAYTAGRERSFVGPHEPFPARRRLVADRAFKAAIAIPFLGGTRAWRSEAFRPIVTAPRATRRGGAVHPAEPPP